MSRTGSGPGTLLGPEGTGASVPPSVRTDVPPNDPAKRHRGVHLWSGALCGARGDSGAGTARILRTA